jgi:hypothetical protein
MRASLLAERASVIRVTLLREVPAALTQRCGGPTSINSIMMN